MLSPAHLRAVVMVVAVASSACVPVFRHADDASTVADAAQPDVTVLDVGPDRASVEEDVASVDVTSPADVVDAAQPAAAQAPLDTICAGDGFSCAIVDSRVRCWGRNDFFQTGNGNTNMGRCDDSSTSACPVRVVDAIKDRNAVQVACGAQFACALNSGGDVYCWGRNEPTMIAGHVGDVDEPTRVGSDSDWERVSVGHEHLCGLRSGGRLFCWGTGVGGRLGYEADAEDTPREVTPGTAYSEVRTSFAFTCAIRTADSVVVCFGDGSAGQLAGRSGSTPEPICLDP